MAEFRIVFQGVLSGTLSPQQGAALFLQDKKSASAYLNDRLSETLSNAVHTGHPLVQSPPDRFMELYWLVLGPEMSVIHLTLFKGTVVDAFKKKLTSALDAFSEADLQLLEDRYYEPPMQQVVINARARRLRPMADALLRNPSEVNTDIADVKRRVSEYNFNPDLNNALDKVDLGLAAGGDPFDQAALLKHLRTFFEKLHEQVGRTLQARKPDLADGTNLGSCGQAIEYLCRKAVLKEKMRDLAKSLYGVLSNEGVHALKSEREYVRLCRNMVAEYALVLFFELERRVGA